MAGIGHQEGRGRWPQIVAMEFWGSLAFTYLPLKRFYKYILKRLIGSFLRHDIDLEQLDVQLYRGIVQLKALELDVTQLNLAVLGAGFLLQFVSGFIGTIKMDIPWRHLLGEHCKIYVDGLHLVLSKGSLPESEATTPPAMDENLTGVGTTTNEAQAAGASQHSDRSGRYRYSNEGIETLSRLVKHVISRMEVCFHNTSVSLMPPGTESQLNARVASVVVFSEQPSSGSEARSVRVLGISLSLLKPCAAIGEPDAGEIEDGAVPLVPAGLRQEELVLLSTDAPHGTALPGVLHIRQRNLDDSITEFGASGVHLDIEFSLDSLRVALAPIVWPVLASCAELFERPLAEGVLQGSSAEDSPVADAPAPSASHRAPSSMMQSLMESSLPGNPGNAGFWSELYNLFEGDSMLEDAAGRSGEMNEEGWEDGEEGAEEDAEEVRALGASVLGSDAADGDEGDASGPGPVVGYLFQIKVRQIGVLLVLSDDIGLVPQPNEVQLSPGPAHSICSDQVQVCVAQWEATVLRPVAELAEAGNGLGGTAAVVTDPKATVLIKTLCMHLHKRRATSEMQGVSAERTSASRDVGREDHEADDEEPSDETAAVWAAPRSAISDALDEDLHDPAMFCSAISTAMTSPAVHLGASALAASAMSTLPAAAVVESPRSSAQSCRCSTDESFGEGSDDESFLHSAESSLHSFNSSVQLATSRAERSGNHIAGSPVIEHELEDALEATESQGLGMESEPAFASVTGAEVDIEEAAGGSRTMGVVAATEPNLEALFFDRSRSIRDVLLGNEGLRADVDGSEESIETDETDIDAGLPLSPCGWHQTTGDFKSKRILHILSRIGPETSSGSADEPHAAVPRWTLPPPEHPLWASLRLGGGDVADGDNVSPMAGSSGYQVRIDWDESCARDLTLCMPALRVECQPIILSLCAESIQMLTSGFSNLRNLSTTPQSTAAPTGGLPQMPLAASVGRGRDQAFSLVSATPLVRLELVLDAAQQECCCIVGDIVAPRLSALPRGDATIDARTGPMQLASDTCYEERLHVEFYDIGGYLISTAGSGDRDERAGSNSSKMGCAGSEFGVGTSAATAVTADVGSVPVSPCSMRILSLDREETFDSDSAASFSIFQRCGSNETTFPEPAVRPHDEVPASSHAGENTTSALADWTKISLPQPEVEGRPSRSTAMLQDLRCASQRLLSGRSDGRQSNTSMPAPLQPRGQTEFEHAAQCERERPGSARSSRSPGISSADYLHACNVGEHTTGSRARREPHSFSVDNSRKVEGHERSVGIATCEGELEVEFKVARNIHLKIDAQRLHLLQESFGTFAGHYAALALDSSTGQQTPLASSANSSFKDEFRTSGVPGAGELPRPGTMLIPLGVTLLLERVRFEVLEGDASIGEQLQFQLSPLQCRFVQTSSFSFKICTLGQDLRLEGMRPLQPYPEQLVRPWFRPIFHQPSEYCCPSALGTESVATSSTAYPWNTQLVQRRTSMILPAFLTVEHGQWRDTHSILLQVEQQRLSNADHMNVSLKVNRIAFHAHPHMQEVYLRLMLFFRPLEPKATQSSQPHMHPNNFTDYEVSTLDCLVDLPSEAYAQTWPITSPFGLNVPMRQPAARGPDGDKWRAVLHIDGLDFSCGTFRGIEVHTGECNVFLVDHPSHLSHLDLISSSPQPSVFLSNFGFAHILEVSGARACWRSGAGEANRGSPTAQSSKGMQSLEVGVDSIAGHVCADTVKCLLCVGMELAENVASWGVGCSEKRAQAVPLIQGRTDSSFSPANVRHAEPRSARSDTSGYSPPGVNILHNIDMFAFEKADEVPSSGCSKPQSPSAMGVSVSAAAADPLESCLIEDYIRTQEQQQALAVHGISSPSDGEAAPFVTEAVWPGGAEVSAMQSSSVAVCLLDPEAYPPERLRELCLQDRIARMEIEQMYAQESDFDPQPVTSTTRVSSSTASDGAADSRKVVHKDGSATVWLIDPAEVQVVQDHFVSQSAPSSRERRGLLPPSRAPPVELVVTGHCGVMRLSIYGGTDFGDDTQARAQVSQASDSSLGGKIGQRKRTTHLTLEFQHSLVKLMSFNTESVGRVGVVNDIFKRRCVVCVKDFGIVDHVHGSVFSHLLSYFEDDRCRPRQNHVDMFCLRIDEVISPPPVTLGMPDRSTTYKIDAPEYSVDLQVLPLRLTLDQDVVDFFLDFVQLCTLPIYVEEEPQDDQSTDVVDTSLLRGADQEGASDEELLSADAEHTRRSSAASADELLNEMLSPAAQGSSPTTRHKSTSSHLSDGTRKRALEGGVRFKSVSVSALLLSVDYRAKRLDVGALRRGELWELVNILPLLEGLEVAFRSVTVSGITGSNQVLAMLVNAWSTDLNRTQILRSLTGVTPIRSFANIGTGFADMVLEPLKQYRAGKDSHQVSSALLRGLVSFLKNVTVESMDLTERILVGTQSALEYVNSCLRELPEGQAPAIAGAQNVEIRPELLDGSDGSLSALSQHWTPVERGATDFLQPGSATEGLQQACTNLTRGMRHAGQAVVGRPFLELQRGASREKVLKSIVSGIPVCVLRPAIEATAAATTALRGVRNSVDPVRRREVVKKYKEPE